MMEYKVTWKSPSNIALVKYWGKYGVQIPKNPSLSITLEEAFTRTTVALEKKRSKKVSCSLLFEGNAKPQFEEKISGYLNSIKDDFPFLQQYHLHIESGNSFPHSSGIASSASSMSALALCICTLHTMTGGKPPKDFLGNASNYARLGSGSACRSIYPEFSIWGKVAGIESSSNKMAIAHPVEYHKDFTDIQDTILIVSKKEKEVSSRAGHDLMNHHPMASIRFRNARQRLNTLLEVLKAGDWSEFIEIAEAEALELHSLMMSSSPSFLLLEPNTVAIIKAIRAFRERTKLPVGFTLDAGPNVHVLYPYFEKRKVRNFIQKELLPLCENQVAIYDHMGRGPLQELA